MPNRQHCKRAMHKSIFQNGITGIHHSKTFRYFRFKFKTMNIFSQQYLHIIFSTENVQKTIGKEWQELLQDFLELTAKKAKQLPIAVHCMSDHVHMLLKLTVDCVPDHLIKSLKESSTQFILENKLCSQKFAWDEEYVIITFSMENIEEMKRYLRNQEIYHTDKTYYQEIGDMMDMLEIPFDEDELKWRQN